MAYKKEYYIYTVQAYNLHAEEWEDDYAFTGPHSGTNLESAKITKKELEEDCAWTHKHRIVKQLVQVGEPEELTESETLIS